MTIDAAIIDLNATTRTCWVCGREAPRNLGIPVYEDFILPNNWRGDWVGAPACPLCYLVQCGLTKPLQVEKMMQQPLSVILLTVNKPPTHNCVTLRGCIEACQQIDAKTHQLTPFIHNGPVIQLRHSSRRGPEACEVLSGSGCTTIFQFPPGMVNATRIAMVKNEPWMNGHFKFYVTGTCQEQVIAYPPCDTLEIYESPTGFYIFGITKSGKNERLAKELRRIADELARDNS